MSCQEMFFNFLHMTFYTLLFLALHQIVKSETYILSLFIGLFFALFSIVISPKMTFNDFFLLKINSDLF